MDSILFAMAWSILNPSLSAVSATSKISFRRSTIAVLVGRVAMSLSLDDLRVGRPWLATMRIALAAAIQGPLPCVTMSLIAFATASILSQVMKSLEKGCFLLSPISTFPPSKREILSGLTIKGSRSYIPSFCAGDFPWGFSALDPPCSIQAVKPPSIWQRFLRPTSCAALVARALRQPLLQ